MFARRRSPSLRRCRSVGFPVLTCLAALPAVLSGQASQGTAEIGATSVSQRGVSRTEAVTAGLGFRHDAARFALAAIGGVTFAEDDRSTTQGLLTASLLGRPERRTRWELGAVGTIFDQEVLSPARGIYLFGREHFALGRARGWAGVAVGGIDDLDRWSPTRSAEVGSWLDTRIARVSASATLVDTRSEPYGAEGRLITDPVTYTDATMGARWVVRRRAEFDARGGLRLISRGALTPSGRGMRAFASVDAAFRLTPQFALVASAGRQLADLARGTPDTRFATLALRVSVRAPATDPASPRRDPAPNVVRPRLTLVIDTSGASFVVDAVAGAVVELAASFTNWEPVTLTRRDGHWELRRAIPSGAHRILVRVDGGPWLVPANLPAAADDFGGSVGIVTVP